MALPVPGILVLCNYLQNVVAITYIFVLQLSTFLFYNKQISENDSKMEKQQTLKMKKDTETTVATATEVVNTIENVVDDKEPTAAPKSPDHSFQEVAATMDQPSSNKD